MTDLWPHQATGIADTISAIEGGETAICLSSPTGGGKSRMAVELILWALERGSKCALYTTRKMLTEQLIRTLSESGVHFGVRASGYDAWTDHDADVQICSSPTESRRVFAARDKSMLEEAEAKSRFRLFDAGLVLVDELHLQKAVTVERIIREHLEHGAVVIGLTATPVGVSHIANKLIVAGTKAELRSYEPPALLPAMTFSCPEIDTKKIKRDARTGEFSNRELRKIYTTHIYGRVVDEFKTLNPENAPAIVFWPGVDESIHGCGAFNEAGIPSAHIDGEDLYVDGERVRSNQEMRDEVLRRHRNGEIIAIHNRWVMREGIDLPYAQHLVLATPVGSIVAYTQIVGRILRAHPSHSHVRVQDHGGNWWRHPSPNDDIDWEMFWDMPERVVSNHHELMQQQKVRENKELELPCEHCGKVLKSMSKPCPACGKFTKKRGRMVIQHDGKLKFQSGDAVKVLRPNYSPESLKLWQKCFYSSKNAGHTFGQARGLYIHLSCDRGMGYYEPPMDFPLMPKSMIDWHRKIVDVPTTRLVTSEEWEHKRRRTA